jgi:hypothetical protein
LHLEVFEGGEYLCKLGLGYEVIDPEVKGAPLHRVTAFVLNLLEGCGDLIGEEGLVTEIKCLDDVIGFQAEVSRGEFPFA